MNQKLRGLLAKGDQASIQAIIAYYKQQDWPVKSLIEEWLVAEINQRNSFFMHWLALLGETELFKTLLQQKAVFNKRDNCRNLPLHYATQHKHQAIVEAILAADNNYSRNNGLATHQLDMFQTNRCGVNATTVAANNSDLFMQSTFRLFRQSFLYDATRSQHPNPTHTNVTVNLGSQSFAPKWQDVVCTGFNSDWIVNPTGQIVSVDSNGVVDRRFCSGFNIGGNYFLTAGHCLGNVCYDIQSNSAANYRVSFNYQIPVCPHSEKSTIQENIYQMTVVEHGTCKDIDYAIFKLEPDAEKYFGRVKLTTAVPAQNSAVVLAHHPDGLPKKFSRGTTTSAESKEGEVQHSAHTLGGSSGSPVGNPCNKEVFAVHVKGNEAQTAHTALTVKAIAAKSNIVRGLTKFGLLKAPVATNHSANQYNSNITSGAVPRYGYSSAG